MVTLLGVHFHHDNVVARVPSNRIQQGSELEGNGESYSF
ncbi:hypothetical protein PMIT1303_00005 [Prochlorococcus sp. MIT 1303]|nr:hypothetical protein PMIT1303_00005 [Prochlorococcus sp. MIT 1303]